MEEVVCNPPCIDFIYKFFSVDNRKESVLRTINVIHQNYLV